MELRAVGGSSLNVCYIRVVHIFRCTVARRRRRCIRPAFQTSHAKFNTRFLLLSYVDILINNMDSSNLTTLIGQSACPTM